MSHVLRHPLVLACALLPLGLAAQAQNGFYTTGTYTINAAHSVVGNAYVGEDSSFNLTNSMGQPYNPTVNLVTGGSVGGDLEAYNSGMVNVSGGSVGNGLFTYSSSKVTVSGGSISKILYTFDSSRVTVSGGSISGSLYAVNSSTLTLTGGSISGGVQAANNSTVTLTGGSINGGLNAGGNSTVTVSGGSIIGDLQANDNSTITVSGGSFSGGFFGGILLARSNSTVTIAGGTFGQDSGVNFLDETTGSFTLVGSNLMAINVGADRTYGGTDYSLSGTLQSGTGLSGYVLNVQTGSTFTLQNAAAVPEPGSVALLAAMGMTGAGWLVRRRRR